MRKTALRRTELRRMARQREVAEERGAKGERRGRVGSFFVLPLSTPLTALSLFDSTQGSPTKGSGYGHPPCEQKPKGSLAKAQTFLQFCLRGLPGRVVKAGVALASCLSGVTQEEGGAIHALAAPRRTPHWFPRKKFHLEYVGGTGAGERFLEQKSSLGAGHSEARSRQLSEAVSCRDGVRHRWRHQEPM